MYRDPTAERPFVRARRIAVRRPETVFNLEPDETRPPGHRDWHSELPVFIRLKGALTDPAARPDAYAVQCRAVVDLQIWRLVARTEV